MSDLYRFIQSVIPRFGSAQALANALDMTLSAFLRGTKQGTLGIENCLKLAALTGENASHVLALAGKQDIATLIESLYGAAATTTLSDVDHALLSLPDGVKRQMLTLVHELRPPQVGRTSASGGDVLAS